MSSYENAVVYYLIPITQNSLTSGIRARGSMQEHIAASWSSSALSGGEVVMLQSIQVF